VGKNQQNITK